MPYLQRMAPGHKRLKGNLPVSVRAQEPITPATSPSATDITFDRRQRNAHELRLAASRAVEQPVRQLLPRARALRSQVQSRSQPEAAIMRKAAVFGIPVGRWIRLGFLDA